MRRKLYTIAEWYRGLFWDMNQNPLYLHVAKRAEEIAEHGSDNQVAAEYNRFVAAIGGMADLP